MKLSRKLTISATGWTKPAIQAALAKLMQDPSKPVDGTEQDLLTFVGIARQAKPGQSDTGDFLRLIGEFRATNLVTGELFQSAQCILPNYISDYMGGALLDPNIKEVAFSIKISAKYKASAATGYEYDCLPLMDTKPSDKLAELMKMTAEKVPLQIASSAAATA